MTRPIRHVLPKEYRRKDGLVDFFSVSISTCTDVLDSTDITRIVVLMRVLLQPKVLFTDQEAEHSAILLIVFIVAGHISGKSGKLVDMSLDHLILNSLHKSLVQVDGETDSAP